MRLDREGRRTVAQFLNGVAVALLATLVLAPLASGSLHALTAVMAIACAAILHGVAIVFGS